MDERRGHGPEPADPDATVDVAPPPIEPKPPESQSSAAS